MYNLFIKSFRILNTINIFFLKINRKFRVATEKWCTVHTFYELVGRSVEGQKCVNT
jgi:hypothetical protein